jgi:hypothetical protein
MNISTLKKDKSIFLSHLSVNNAVASKSRDLRRLSSYSHLTRHFGDSDVEESVSAESSAGADRDRDRDRDRTHHERNERNMISARQRQQQHEHVDFSRYSCPSDEEMQNIARAVERIRGSVESTGETEQCKPKLQQITL